MRNRLLIAAALIFVMCCVLSNSAYPQSDQPTLLNCKAAINQAKLYCQYLTELSDGNTDALAWMETILDMKNNLAFDDITGTEREMGFSSLHGIILTRKGKFSIECGTLPEMNMLLWFEHFSSSGINDQPTSAIIIVPVSKTVNGRKKDGFLLIKAATGKIMNYYKTIPSDFKQLKFIEPIKPDPGTSSEVVLAGSDYTEYIGDVPIHMVFVQGGTFTMGCTKEQGKDCSFDEKPPHEVILNDFYIGKFELTEKQWYTVMEKDPNWPSGSTGCDDCPVGIGDWGHIKSIFIDRLNEKTGKQYRLPTEAEWEYAARGGNKSTGYKYSGSDKLSEVAWFGGKDSYDIYNQTGAKQKVGQKKPNELGLYDMSGNVSEWCSDFYYFAYYEESPAENPKGYWYSDYHVNRGGTCVSTADECRVASRKNKQYRYAGFRIAISK